jgi:hypothetical protein
MGAFRQSTVTGRQAVDVSDGTLCRAESPRPKSLGHTVAARGKRRIKALGFDGAKVHEFLFHVALAEIFWQDLTSGTSADQSADVRNHRARNQASTLYGSFLDACSKGPRQAAAFLAAQHELQRDYLRKSQAILKTQQRDAARNQAVLSEVAFGLQTVKSAATVGVAIIGLFLAGPEIVAGSIVALGFDVSMQLISKLGPSNEPEADTVIVGFKQSVANDVVGVAGSAQQVGMEATRDVLQQTLSYPLKSSTFRSATSNAAGLSHLLTTLGVISAGVTLYSEYESSRSSFEEMQKNNGSYSAMQNSQ